MTFCILCMKRIFFILKAVGDPTVKIFASRDIDSYIQDREAFAVQVLDIMEIQGVPINMGIQ